MDLEGILFAGKPGTPPEKKLEEPSLRDDSSVEDSTRRATMEFASMMWQLLAPQPLLLPAELGASVNDVVERSAKQIDILFGAAEPNTLTSLLTGMTPVENVLFEQKTGESKVTSDTRNNEEQASDSGVNREGLNKVTDQKPVEQKPLARTQEVPDVTPHAADDGKAQKQPRVTFERVVAALQANDSTVHPLMTNPEKLAAAMKLTAELKAVAERFASGLPRGAFERIVPSFAFSVERSDTENAEGLSNKSVERHSSVAPLSKMSDSGESLYRYSRFLDSPDASPASRETGTVATPTSKAPVELVRQDTKTSEAAADSSEQANTNVPPSQMLQKARTETQQITFDVQPQASPMGASPKGASVESFSEVRTQGSLSVPVLPEDFARDFAVKVSEPLRLHIQGNTFRGNTFRGNTFQGNTSEVRVVLKPESLGELSIRVAMENGKITAHMIVQEPLVKAALEAQIPQLRETLASQGIDVNRFEIVSGNGGMQFNNSDEGKTFHPRLRRGHTDVDAVEEYETARSLGYNTIEYII